MNISLTPQLEELVKAKVRSGRYHSSSEVVRDALRLLEDHDRLREMRLEDLRKEVALGLADVEAGRVGPLDMDELRAKARARFEASKRQETPT